ncbi:MAG: biotin synthase BioB, partial [Candidatus Brocadiia bacterium]
WQDNYDVIVSARELGLQTCCGGLFGLGESIEQRAMFLDELRNLSPDGIPINFLIPVAGTPLEGTTIIDPDSALRIIAAARLAMPDKEIIICGGRCEVLRDRLAEVFAAGADGLMTGDYLTVRGSSPDVDRALLRRAGLDYRAKGIRL